VADLSYQSLINSLMMAPPPPQSMWQGLSNPQAQLPPIDPNDPSGLAMMREKQFQQGENLSTMREISPGMTWGGRDRNAVQPDDVMKNYFYGPPSAGNT
jgi:hypothetical protein